MKKHLFVIAHPDDELLGAGAYIDKISKTEKVYVLVLNSSDITRYKDQGKLKEQLKETHKMLNVDKTYVASLEDGNFSNENHRQIVEIIESCIKDIEPDYIYTHHYNDMNYDHFITYQCCIEASRYSFRGIYNCNELKGLYLMEVPSETGWGFVNTFKPTKYVNVEENNIDNEIKALKVYDNVIRKSPHPRSEENIKALARIRGSQCNSIYAMAFEVYYEKE